MFVLLTVFTLFAYIYANPTTGELGGRIIHGYPTTIEKHPYQVSLQNVLGDHVCGGSLIDNVTILTAGHCLKSFYSPSVMIAHIGSTHYDQGGEEVDVRAFKRHENFNYHIFSNDIAVVKLATPVRQSSTVRAIKLAKTTPKQDTLAIISGWGNTRCTEPKLCYGDPSILQSGQVKIIDRQECASSKYQYGADIKEGMFCATNDSQDACTGDSGGPIVANGELVGVISFGQGCGDPKYPGVYTDVAYFYDWIAKTSAEL